MRWILCTTMALAGSLASNTVWGQHHQDNKTIAARNINWPQPFRGADAEAVVAPFEVMRNNGWREHNTLGSRLFAQDNSLCEAGALKVQWIVTQAPLSYRAIYVKSGPTQEITNARVESVQLAVSQLVPSGPLPQIFVIDLEPTTSSGAYQTLVHRALIKTTPTPRLQNFTGLNNPSQQTVAPGAGQANGSSSSGNK
jgi:hypothetical protein